MLTRACSASLVTWRLAVFVFLRVCGCRLGLPLGSVAGVCRREEGLDSTRFGSSTAGQMEAPRHGQMSRVDGRAKVQGCKGELARRSWVVGRSLPLGCVVRARERTRRCQRVKCSDGRLPAWVRSALRALTVASPERRRNNQQPWDDRGVGATRVSQREHRTAFRAHFTTAAVGPTDALAGAHRVEEHNDEFRLSMAAHRQERRVHSQSHPHTKGRPPRSCSRRGRS